MTLSDVDFFAYDCEKQSPIIRLCQYQTTFLTFFTLFFCISLTHTQIGDEVNGMIMVRSAEGRQGICPAKYLQEV